MFCDVEHALEYAYRVSRSDIVEVSRAIANLRSSGIQARRSFGDLTSHEHHAQAAFIIGHVEELSPVQRNLIDGKYDRGLRWPAIEVLANLIGYDKLGLAPTRELIAAYLGEKNNQDGDRISMRRLANEYGGSPMLYSREARRINDELVKVELVALNQLESTLRGMMNKAEAA